MNGKSQSACERQKSKCLWTAKVKVLVNGKSQSTCERQKSKYLWTAKVKVLVNGKSQSACERQKSKSQNAWIVCLSWQYSDHVTFTIGAVYDNNKYGQKYLLCTLSFQCKRFVSFLRISPVTAYSITQYRYETTQALYPTQWFYWY
mgnify:CR=1 FL=1